jgi:hypothetical protein
MIASAAIGIVAEEEFADAQAAIGELKSYCDYEDWLDARWGLHIGLAMAGVYARMVVVDLASFLGWRDRTGKPADERSLDAFAALAAATEAVVVTAPMVAVDRCRSLSPNRTHDPQNAGETRVEDSSKSLVSKNATLN